MKTSLKSLTPTWILTLALLVCTSHSARADLLYVTTYGSGGVSSTTLTPCAPDAGVASVCTNPLGLGGTISTSGSTSVVNPPGAPAHSKCIYGFTNATSMGTVSWSIQLPPVNGSVFALYTAHTDASSTTSNALVTLFSPDGVCSASCTNTPVFQKAYGGNIWSFIGYFYKNPGVTQPTLIFYHSGGTIDNGGNPGNRLYIDCFKFEFLSPWVEITPSTLTVPAGSNAVLEAHAQGTPPMTYQWFHDGRLLAGATLSAYTITNAAVGDAGGYSVSVTNADGAITSAQATVFVYAPVSITLPPANQVVPARATAAFEVAASGYPAPSFQWTFQGTNLPGATTSRLTIANVQLTDCGEYTVLVSNGYPSDRSASATLSMSPTLLTPYAGTTAVWGRSATLAVGAIGSGELSYQWFKDGQPIALATNDTYTVPVVQLTDGGFYSVVVSSPWGSVTNTPAQFVVNPAEVDLGLYAGIKIGGTPGYRYTIQYTTDLTDSNSWVTLTNLTLQQPVELWVDTTTNAAETHRRFYHVLPGQ